MRRHLLKTYSSVVTARSFDINVVQLSILRHKSQTLRILNINNVAVADSARRVGYFGGGTTALFLSMSRSLINMLCSQKLCRGISWFVSFTRNGDFPAS